MSKKKGHCKQIPKDFTLGDYANSQKPQSKVKKTLTPYAEAENQSELAWDQIHDSEDIDIIKEVNLDGTTSLVCIKKPIKPLNVGNEYPEIVWYEISRHINPEDIARFASINRTTLSITQQKSFWVNIYEKYCKKSSKLPVKMRIEDGAKTYGYKARVIRALYCTHNVFSKKIMTQGEQFSKPHDMIKCRCVNMWYHEINTDYSTVYFKFKKLPQQQASNKVEYDFIEELGRLDANPELDNQVLQVNCKLHNRVPPLVIGMILTSVRMGLARNMRSNSLVMGFNSGSYVAKNVQPECSLFLDNVLKIMVIDWWHPNYPNFVIRLPWETMDREREEDMDEPLLERDFFAPYCIDQDSDTTACEQLENNWDEHILTPEALATLAV